MSPFCYQNCLHLLEMVGSGLFLQPVYPRNSMQLHLVGHKEQLSFKEEKEKKLFYSL